MKSAHRCPDFDYGIVRPGDPMMAFCLCDEPETDWTNEAEVGDQSVRTIPGTADDYVRCDYDELCSEAREAIDAVLASHVAGVMREPVALMILRYLGLCDVAAADLLSAERHEASQP